MTSYVKSTNFASKDSLASGNPLKIVKGTEIDIEFNNIATAVDSKADTTSPTFSGIPLAPTAAAGNNTTQLATTAFVTSAVSPKAEKTTTITAGTGLSGGGDLSADRTLSLANTAVTAGSYGSSSAIPVVTVNAQGQVTSASTATLSLAEIGVAQTWQNVLGSRALSTNYTNSTGKPIQVIAAVYAQGGTRCRAIVSGVTIVESLTQDCCGVPQISYFPLSFIVPNGATYQVQGGAVNTWAELR